MQRKIVLFVICVFLIFILTTLSWAHFGMIIPSDDLITQEDPKNITLSVRFAHPFEGHLMNMLKPKHFGVFIRGKHFDLLNTLKEKKIDGYTSWETNYEIKKAGDHIFYVEPEPYWEPAEEIFIIHYTKVVVDAFGLEKDWDEELGLKTEIIPLTRPYGLWTGNLFCGIVKLDGKPVPYAEVEVEFYNYNDKNAIKPPASPFVTQVIKADQNGVFSYAMPRTGWWGFSALNTDTKKIKHDNGNEYPVEIGAVFWVKTYDMK